MTKPNITRKTNRSNANELTIEFSSSDEMLPYFAGSHYAGGLIQFVNTKDGLMVLVKRCDNCYVLVEKQAAAVMKVLVEVKNGEPGTPIDWGYSDYYQEEADRRNRAMALQMYTSDEVDSPGFMLKWLANRKIDRAPYWDVIILDGRDDE